MMMISLFRTISTILLVVCAHIEFILGYEEREGLNSIILVGATSNLAKKYLWQSIFSSYAFGFLGSEVLIVGGATRGHDEGNKLLNEILDSSLSCSVLESLISFAECGKILTRFVSNTRYQQLKYEDNYLALNSMINEEATGRNVSETGRLYYLSISPDFYERTAKAIDSFGRPIPSDSAQNTPWLRVALEKPFGKDFHSALVLSSNLKKYLKEHEMYLVDHYLKKAAVLAIRQTREANIEFENHLKAISIDSIKIIMKEKENCEGRTGFFDHYGTIRDVHQNHLTQILLQLTVDVEKQEKSEILKKLNLFNFSLDSSDSGSDPFIYRGQYEEYNEHVRTDRYAPENFTSSKTETSAAVVLEVLTVRWSGTPFVLFAGKALNEREAYVEIVFEPGVCSFVWGIQGGLYGTSLSYDDSCPFAQNFTPPYGWKDQGVYGGRVWFEPRSETNVYSAYDIVVQKIASGNQSMFMSVDELLLQWSFWDVVLQVAETQDLIKYSQGSDGYYFENQMEEIKQSCTQL